jgi:hypothetical protein
MEILLCLIYVSICYVIFKLFRIPVNQWSLSTAALGGIFGISLLPLVHELQPPFHLECSYLFCGHADIAVRKGARDRDSGHGQQASKAGR